MNERFRSLDRRQCECAGIAFFHRQARGSADDLARLSGRVLCPARHRGISHLGIVFENIAQIPAHGVAHLICG